MTDENRRAGQLSTVADSGRHGGQPYLTNQQFAFMALQIKPENDKSEPLEDNSGRKTTTQGLWRTIQAGKRRVMLKGSNIRQHFFSQFSALSPYFP